MRCEVLNCGMTNENKASECSFFIFPTDKSKVKEWIKFCRKGNFDPKQKAICMKHFASDAFENNLKFEMGFAKYRRLKRGAVPTIYKAPPAKPERAKRIQSRANKKIVDELLREADISSANISKNLAQEVEDLKKEIEVLRQENLRLGTAQREHDRELAAIANASRCKEKKRAHKIRVLEDRATKAEAKCKNMEEMLATIFTEGQVDKVKNGRKKKSWTEEEIARSINFYTTNSKSYKLMYSKGFPIPAVRTLQKWAKNIVISDEQSADHIQFEDGDEPVVEEVLIEEVPDEDMLDENMLDEDRLVEELLEAEVLDEDMVDEDMLDEELLEEEVLDVHQY